MIGKNSIKGAPWINIAVNYCCTLVLLYTKMLKETKAEETIVVFVTFLSLAAFPLRGPGLPGPPSGYAYAPDFVCCGDSTESGMKFRVFWGVEKRVELDRYIGQLIYIGQYHGQADISYRLSTTDKVSD